MSNSKITMLLRDELWSQHCQPRTNFKMDSSSNQNNLFNTQLRDNSVICYSRFSIAVKVNEPCVVLPEDSGFDEEVDDDDNIKSFAFFLVTFSSMKSATRPGFVIFMDSISTSPVNIFTTVDIVGRSFDESWVHRRPTFKNKHAFLMSKSSDSVASMINSNAWLKAVMGIAKYTTLRKHGYKHKSGSNRRNAGSSHAINVSGNMYRRQQRSKVWLHYLQDAKQNVTATSILESPSMQAPYNLTRFSCTISDIAAISDKNSFAPCVESVDSTFTATLIPFGSVPYSNQSKT
ncbi:hypothetical protein M5K25_012278 [Dendrobium thyrsiflorum]|uniref:Uncharacterized protein n=1 Tax=Dendrobium thyrsiflorum TaxID=117978 RepID=A0ABD0UX77_DENTH